MFSVSSSDLAIIHWHSCMHNVLYRSIIWKLLDQGDIYNTLRVPKDIWNRLIPHSYHNCTPLKVMAMLIDQYTQENKCTNVKIRMLFIIFGYQGTHTRYPRKKLVLPQSDINNSLVIPHRSCTVRKTHQTFSARWVQRNSISRPLSGLLLPYCCKDG
jgi:hypothetical protein